MTKLRYWLVASIRIHESLQWSVTYTAVPLALIISLYFLKRERDKMVPFVFLWALFGIAVKNYSDHFFFQRLLF